MSDRVVTVTPTIMSGTVVRWHTSEASAEYGASIISASREGVMGHEGFITPPDFEAAWAAYQAISRREPVTHLATHQRRGLLGPLEPVRVREVSE